MTFKIGKQHTFLVQLHAEVRYEHDFCFDGPQLRVSGILCLGDNQP